MNIQMIPLDKLIPSAANVRKTGSGTGIEELAANIEALGLLQNLQVRPAAKGKFEVVAGGRRLAALNLLVKRKAFAKSAKICCNVIDGADAGEISLAENVIRLPMHPADQFEAFKALADSGKGPEEIAARFGTSPAIVRQRLKLASVSPRLIGAYRAEEMSLDQLMAFAVSDDQAAQEAAWENLPVFNRGPAAIRRILMAAHVEADDPRAIFVGLDAYLAAGGGIVRDLFDTEHEGYLADPALLDRLAAEKLEREAATVRAEGWKWVEISPALDYETLRRFGHVAPERQPLPAKQQKKLDKLTAEYDSLIEEHGDDPEPEIADKLEALSAQIDALAESHLAWRSEDLASAGAIVTIGRDGSPRIERGLVRPEDKPKPTKGEAAEAEPDAAPATGLSAKLIAALTAERTAALRVMLADNAAVALAAIVHALALPLFYGSLPPETCLELRAVSADLRRAGVGAAESAALAAFGQREAEWLQQLPQEPEQLWDWLVAQPQGTLLRLLAHCAAASVNAVRKPHDRVTAPHLAHADRLAGALGLHMAEWWQPAKDSYLGRVSKALILDAVTEAVSKQAADNIAPLKKGVIVARAEELLAGKGWLPVLLRSSAPPQEEAAAA